MIPDAELGSHAVVLRSCQDISQQSSIVRVPAGFLETTVHGHSHNLALCLTLKDREMTEAMRHGFRAVFAVKPSVFLLRRTQRGFQQMLYFE